VRFDQDGTLRLIDLPSSIKHQIGERLAERRVVQHIPKDMTGLRAEQNAWRVVQVEDGVATLRQRMRQPDGSKISKERKERVDKLVGLQPGKLSKLRASLVVGENYGLAILDYANSDDDKLVIIPWHQVWNRLKALRSRNAEKPLRMLRKGCQIRILGGSRKGVWRVISIKDTVAYGIAIDLVDLDGVKLAKGNAPVETLLKDGLEILETTLLGGLD